MVKVHLLVKNRAETHRDMHQSQQLGSMYKKFEIVLKPKLYLKKRGGHSHDYLDIYSFFFLG